MGIAIGAAGSPDDLGRCTEPIQRGPADFVSARRDEIEKPVEDGYRVDVLDAAQRRHVEDVTRRLFERAQVRAAISSGPGTVDVVPFGPQADATRDSLLRCADHHGPSGPPGCHEHETRCTGLRKITGETSSCIHANPLSDGNEDS